MLSKGNLGNGSGVTHHRSICRKYYSLYIIQNRNKWFIYRNDSFSFFDILIEAAKIHHNSPFRHFCDMGVICDSYNNCINMISLFMELFGLACICASVQISELVG